MSTMRIACLNEGFDQFVYLRNPVAHTFRVVKDVASVTISWQQDARDVLPSTTGHFSITLRMTPAIRKEMAKTTKFVRCWGLVNGLYITGERDKGVFPAVHIGDTVYVNTSVMHKFGV